MPAKRNVKPVSAKPASVAPAAAKAAAPVKPETTATTKPVAPVAPVATPAPAKPVAAKPATDAAAMPRGLVRDAIGIVRQATNYAQYSDRDSAYLAFFGSVLRAHGHTATLRQIHDAGISRDGMPSGKRYNPNYTGSGKATDVGAINRLIKAGHLTRSADGNTLTATAFAQSNAIYRGSKAS